MLELIMMCISTNSMQVFWNGEVTDAFLFAVSRSYTGIPYISYYFYIYWKD